MSQGLCVICFLCLKVSPDISCGWLLLPFQSQVKHLPEGPSQTPPSQQFPREPPSCHTASFLPPHSSNTGIFLLNCSVSGSSHNITSMRKGTWSPLFFAVSLMLFSSPFPVISYSFLILLLNIFQKGLDKLLPRWGIVEPFKNRKDEFHIIYAIFLQLCKIHAKKDGK